MGSGNEQGGEKGGILSDIGRERKSKIQQDRQTGRRENLWSQRFAVQGMLRPRAFATVANLVNGANTVLKCI